MTIRTVRSAGLLVLASWTLSLPAATQGDEPGAYVRGEDWASTMLASRERLQAEDGDRSLQLGPWLATAPLPGSFEETHVPLRGADLAATGEDGRALWTERPEYVDGAVHNLPLLDQASTYLYRVIVAEGAQSHMASLGSDDGIEVWLNGEELHSRDVARGAGPDQEKVTLHLVPGVNELLLKIHNNAGGHGFYFSMRESRGLGLWTRIEAEFPEECARFARDLAGNRHLVWFREAGEARLSRDLVGGLLDGLELARGEARAQYEALVDARAPARDPRWLGLYGTLCRIRAARADLGALDLFALRRAIEDLSTSFPEHYALGDLLLAKLGIYETRLAEAETHLAQGSLPFLENVERTLAEAADFRREALLGNPLLDFDQLLLIKRSASSPALGLPQNWQGNCSLPRKGFADEIAILSPLAAEAELTTFFRPERDSFVGDLDLEFDGEKMLFSSLDENQRWQIFELDAAGEELRQVTVDEGPGVDNYDACYLPDGRILFDSTRCFQGIPCVGGADAVANLYLMSADGENVRQLCFDQDHDWCPTVLNNGQVLFTRWEYSDTPHYFTRLLMRMNPDGTGQMEYYGSNSMWPNSIFYGRPIPGHATQVVGIVSGHHGVPRMGELVIFDPALGRFEADGVVQRIPGWGEEVEPVIVDQLVNNSWPRFLHPWPLSEKYFLVSCKPSPEKPWGIYLVDVFDNLLCLAEEPGYALFEPVPFRPTPRPPSIPDKVRLDRDDATIYLSDVYRGPGLEGVPRGTIKSLRVYEFHYGYNDMGGHKHVGIEGPWDVHRILGTVPVHEDGSAAFAVPANTPLAVQPLDERGRAVQLMRSWFTAMPGEVLSCAGCHENQNSGPPARPTIAARSTPLEIEPWYGPTRGFDFQHEVQPVLDRSCVGCHDGNPALPDFTRRGDDGWLGFTPSYIALHPYVRRPGPESDYHLLEPYEYHASTSELIQLLEKGHHGVQLDQEAWDRLVTWIDLNVPDHGAWSEHADIPGSCASRRAEMRARFAGIEEDPELLPPLPSEPLAFVPPREPIPTPPAAIHCEDWPLDAARAQELQRSSGLAEALTLDLGEGVTMELVPIPAGSFIMGEAGALPDEVPRARVDIERPFYMGALEVTHEQYRRFDPEHDNGVLDQNHKDHTTRGYPANGPRRPAMRLSWQQALEFCEWLSAETGMDCSLPTEAEWEWACRAGSASPFSWGGLDDDFSAHANLADASTSRLAVTGINPQPIPNPSQYEDWLPKEARFDDGQRLMCDVGQYEPNAWGLHDMHGNVNEWTLSDYAPYPYAADDGRNELAPVNRKAVRGGSWRDRPRSARSAWRLGYEPFQRVFNVGFRVVVAPVDEQER